MPKESEIMKLKRYPVSLMTPYCAWDVEAASENEAIKKIRMPDEFDRADEHMLIAVEEDKDFYEKT